MSEYKRIIIIHWSMTYVLFSIPIKQSQLLFPRLITLLLGNCSSKYIPFYNVPEIFNRNMHQVIFGQEFRASSVSHLISSYEEIRCYLSDVNVIWFRFSRFVLSYLSTTVWNIVVILQVLCPFSVWKLSICQNWRHVTVFCKLCCFSHRSQVRVVNLSNKVSFNFVTGALSVSVPHVFGKILVHAKDPRILGS